MTKNTFTDPYRDVPQEEKCRLTTWLPDDERMFLIGIRPGKGTVQVTINRLLKGLIDECRKRGINHYDHMAEFEKLVIERGERGSNGSSALATELAGYKTTPTDDAGGTETVHNTPKNVQEQSPNPSVRGRGRRTATGEKAGT